MDTRNWMALLVALGAAFMVVGCGQREEGEPMPAAEPGEEIPDADELYEEPEAVEPAEAPAVVEDEQDVEATELEWSEDEDLRMDAEDEAGGFQMNITDEGASISAGGGATSFQLGAQASIPADWPEDVPTYEGMKVGSATKNEGEGLYAITGTADDDAKQVVDELHSGLEAEGWEEVTRVDQANRLYVRSFQKDGRQVKLTIQGSPQGGSSLQIALTRSNA
jgi:hypothetical protein